KVQKELYREKNIKDFLYYLLKPDLKVCSFLNSFLKKDEYGVSSFLLGGTINPLKLLSENDYSEFLSFIISAKIFDLIVIDAGNTFSGNSLLSHNIADKVCFFLDDIDENRALEYLKEKVNTANGKDKIIQHESYFLNTFNNFERKELADFSLDLSEKFGDYIRKLTKEMSKE
ncbi:MAG: hypothetical protein ACRCUS_03305, partial [Anaerovoracaceae bacterium]